MIPIPGGHRAPSGDSHPHSPAEKVTTPTSPGVHVNELVYLARHLWVVFSCAFFFVCVFF